jgi:hypothetical protein
MTRHFALSLLLLIAFVLPVSARAQDMARALDAIPRNSVVRLRGPDLRRVQGRIGEVTGDTVFVRSGSRMTAVPIARITRAEVATDRDHVRGMLNGARIGAVTGGVIGAVLINAACDNCSRSQHLQASAVGIRLRRALVRGGSGRTGGAGDRHPELAARAPRRRPPRSPGARRGRTDRPRHLAPHPLATRPVGPGPLPASRPLTAVRRRLSVLAS